MGRGYQVLPLVYDRWQKSYGKDYSTLILPRVLASVKRFGTADRSLVDLACGTGTLALAMARRGWRSWGVDASPMMIEVASQKRRPSRIAGFLRQDMRDLHLPERVHLATCLFDSLNHLRSVRELGRTFSAVADSLHEGGLFIFDLNTERCYRTLWTGTQAVHHPDFTLLMQNSYEPRRTTAHSLVTLFLRRRREFMRFTEVVQEKYFPNEAVASMLRRAGFRILQHEEFNFTKIREVGDIKSWWVARKVA